MREEGEKRFSDVALNIAFVVFYFSRLFLHPLTLVHFFRACSSRDGIMVRIELSSHYERRSRSGRMFTLYCLQVYWKGGKNSIEKRYRDFYKLHCQLKKYQMDLPLLEFPPKTLKKLDPLVIEYRIKSLERYLQSVIENCKDWPTVLIDFLQLPSEVVSCVHHSRTPLQITASETDEDECVLSHGPLIGFKTQIQTISVPYEGKRGNWISKRWKEDSTAGQECHSRESCSSLTDIVMKASLEAFYSDIH